jgi:hypothetical protein
VAYVETHLNVLEDIITKARAIKAVRADAKKLENVGLAKPAEYRYYVLCAELVSEIAGYMKPSEGR